MGTLRNQFPHSLWCWKSLGVTHPFPIGIVFFLFMHWYYAYYRIVSPVSNSSSSLALFSFIVCLGSDWWRRRRRRKCNLTAITEFWGCNITKADPVKDFLYIIAGSGAREAIRNHADGFLASWLFSGFPYSWCIFNFWQLWDIERDAIHTRVHSLH